MKGTWTLINSLLNKGKPESKPCLIQGTCKLMMTKKLLTRLMIILSMLLLNSSMSFHIVTLHFSPFCQTDVLIPSS